MYIASSCTIWHSKHGWFDGIGQKEKAHYVVHRKKPTQSQHLHTASLTNKALGSSCSLAGETLAIPIQGGRGQRVLPEMFNVFVSQKRMSFLHGIFRKSNKRHLYSTLYCTSAQNMDGLMELGRKKSALFDHRRSKSPRVGKGGKKKEHTM